jgi:hypothetical protein
MRQPEFASASACPFLARAPIAQPGPGNWKKFYNGSFSEPGVGSLSSPVDALAVGYWLTADKTVSIKWVRGGLGVALSQDRIHFTDALSEPLMPTEPGDWSRHSRFDVPLATVMSFIVAR